MNMKQQVVAALLAISFGGSAYAQENYAIDPYHTFPYFQVSHLGFSVMHGRFNKTGGKITLDRAAKQGTIDISIEAASIDTGHGKRDTHLKSDDFFNVDKYPALTFTSKKLKFSGDKLVGAEGELTLLGVTKPVSLALSHFHCGPHPISKKETCGANAATTIKRSDFGMRYALPGVGDYITIAIEVEAVRD